MTLVNNELIQLAENSIQPSWLAQPATQSPN